MPFKTRCEYIPVRLVHPLSLRMTVLNGIPDPETVLLFLTFYDMNVILRA